MKTISQMTREEKLQVILEYTPYRTERAPLPFGGTP